MWTSFPKTWNWGFSPGFMPGGRESRWPLLASMPHLVPYNDRCCPMRCELLGEDLQGNLDHRGLEQCSFPWKRSVKTRWIRLQCAARIFSLKTNKSCKLLLSFWWRKSIESLNTSNKNTWQHHMSIWTDAISVELFFDYDHKGESHTSFSWSSVELIKWWNSKVFKIVKYFLCLLHVS